MHGSLPTSIYELMVVTVSSSSSSSSSTSRTRTRSRDGLGYANQSGRASGLPPQTFKNTNERLLEPADITVRSQGAAWE